MSELPPDPEFGAVQRRYGTNRNTLLVILGIGALVIMAGVAGTASTPALALMVPLGVIILLFGVVRYPVFGSATVYEKGFAYRAYLRKPRRYRFEEVDGFYLSYRQQLEGGDVGFLGAAIMNKDTHKPFRYFFYGNGVQLFGIEPAFGEWREFGDWLVSDVRARFMSKLRGELDSGKTATIEMQKPNPTVTLFGKTMLPTRISISPEGIQQDDGAVLKWQDIDLKNSNFNFSGMVNLRGANNNSISYFLATVNATNLTEFLQKEITQRQPVQPV